VGNSCIDIIGYLKIHKLLYVVFVCEYAAFSRFMLQDSALQIIGDARVQNCIVFVSHDVDAVLFFGHTSLYVIASVSEAIYLSEVGVIRMSDKIFYYIETV
jgi:hypothetical protein